MKAYYTIEVRDKEGKLLRRFRWRSKSYVKQWNQAVYVQLNDITSYSMLDITNTSRSISYNASVSNMSIAGAANEDDNGIVIGTGSTAVAIANYKLATQIAHGTGSGKMSYLAQAVLDTPTVSGSDCYFRIRRAFINSSGGTITVAEIGIYGEMYITGPTACNFLFVRDVLASAVEVPDGGTITVTYTIKITV